MADPSGPGEDDLLKRARSLQDKAARTEERSSPGAESGLAELLSRNEFIAAFMRFARQVRRWTGPIGTLLAWFFGRLAEGIRFAAFRRENGQFLRDEDGDLVYSFRRLVGVLSLTLAGVVLVHVVLSAAYFYSTYFHETVYVTGKQEIETGELYQFGGCTSLPCSTTADNGKFYLIETSLYFPVLFYPEEEVFANVPQQNGVCNIEGYGLYFRTLRWLYKHAQLYQHVVQVSCRPYTEDEIRQVMKSGEHVS